MKASFPLILSFLLFISIESIIQVNAKCWEYVNPLEPWKKTASSICGTQKTPPETKLSGDIGGNGKISNQASILAPEEAFKIVFTCTVPDQVLCGKAENSFKSAGEIIAKVINFNTQVVVNATFANFCQSLGECGGTILGAAGAARSIPLQDNDNVIRQYPQALAKQFLLQPPPQWGQFDIQAFFNAEANLFFGDGQIGPRQFDFQYIITHELIHGLGFASEWNNYLTDDPVALTPSPSFLEMLTSLDQPAKFTGFEEGAFDKYMVNAKLQGQSPKRMSDYAAQLNGFAKVGTQFPTVLDLLKTFQKSPQFKISTDLIRDSQTSKTFAFQPQNAKDTNDLIFLETNIRPFQRGSSISHVDLPSFSNSSDFLEIFNAKRGQSLSQIIAAFGGDSPIGPKLLSVLETLGYATANNPNPYKPRLPNSPKLETTPQPPLPVANSKNSNGNNNNGINQKSSIATSLTSSFNILTIFIIVAVTLLF